MAHQPDFGRPLRDRPHAQPRDRTQREVFVDAFPTPRRRQRVSTAGDSNPVWRAEGRELFFVNRERQLVSVGVAGAEGAPRFTPPTALIDGLPVCPVEGRLQ